MVVTGVPQPERQLAPMRPAHPRRDQETRADPQSPSWITHATAKERDVVVLRQCHRGLRDDPVEHGPQRTTTRVVDDGPLPQDDAWCQDLMHRFLLTASLVSTLGAQDSLTVANPTFTEHVAPIVFRHCAQCHRPGEAAPFSLLTYADVRKRSRMIATVTGDRFMPPWHASPGHAAFVGERRLGEHEITTLAAWAHAGAPEGPASALPETPQFPAGWQLGEPDLVVAMEEEYPIPASGPDIYRNFVLELGLDEERWIRAIELRPSARKAVHHSLFFVDTSGSARAQDGRDGKPGFRGMRFTGSQRGAQGSDTSLAGWGQLGGWAVGMTPTFLPEGLAMHLPAGADIVLQTHFHPSGKSESERSTIGIWFGEKPTKTLTGLQLPPVFGALWGIDIPPGAKAYEVRDSFTLPVAIDGISIGGHAHYLCTDMRANAVLPSGEELVLLDIARWDFNWQDRYMFAEPLRLPAGTKLDFVLHYDNSDANPFNPHDPPRRVRWGRESEDEMGSLTLQAVCVDEGDLPTLHRALREQATASARKRVARETKARVRGYDTDGDGSVKITDLPRAWQALAARADTNADGMLDAAEIDSAELGVGQRRR